jgi:hypothetical protein
MDRLLSVNLKEEFLSQKFTQFVKKSVAPKKTERQTEKISFNEMDSSFQKSKIKNPSFQQSEQ